MPIIDLKNTSIYFEDGYTETGAINLMAGYVAGVSTVVVDGILGILPVGARLSLDGDDRYTVVSTIETGGNTTSITFTPATAAALVDDDVVIVYGTFLEIKVGEGTITWSEKKPREYKKDRGRLYEVRNGDEEPVDVTMNFMYEGLVASDPMTDAPTPFEALKRSGPAADWVNADTSSECGPYAINIRIDWTPDGCDDPETERVVLPYFRYEQLDFNPKEGSVNCTGKCNVTEATVTRFNRV
jgi:hypothetical protein